jgi:hypothetical protein
MQVIQTVVMALNKDYSMTQEEKINKLKKLGNDMYIAAQSLMSDASRLHKAMEAWHQFIKQEEQL